MQERAISGPASSHLWEALVFATSPFSSPTLSPRATVSLPSSESRRPVSRPQGSCLPELNFKCNSKCPAKSFGWGSEWGPLPDPNPHRVGWVGQGQGAPQGVWGTLRPGGQAPGGPRKLLSACRDIGGQEGKAASPGSAPGGQVGQGPPPTLGDTDTESLRTSTEVAAAYLCQPRVGGEAAPEASPHTGGGASQDPSLGTAHETGTPALSPYLEKRLQPQTGRATQTLPCRWQGGRAQSSLPLHGTLRVLFPLTASSLAFTPRHFAGTPPCSSL